MMTNPAPRPAEWLHTPACLAHAMICAVENMRDAADGALTFRMQAQQNDALAWADEYLTSGTVDCRCHMWDLGTNDAGAAVGRCSCGWQGSPRDDQFAAARDARVHSETATA